MKLRTRIQTLVAASMLALVAVSLSVGQADAKPRRPVQFGTCALPGSVVGQPEDWVFYVVGGIVTFKDSQGNEHAVECGPDGQWTVLYISGKPLVGRPVVSLPSSAATQP